ncbi:hypothetical protein [Rhizobium sp. Leaf386]|uniref:hypothetical protein n=1 Tax=Rhizobium sp. Leaf386 TaxID=1736359 RepID=UPI0007132D23|nr:hypothetical protein [Rhizobium sp. Leaf386]KQT04135.1 hypothetical protein ASG50_18220 [Rhizobium sp. Leaf386]
MSNPYEEGPFRQASDMETPLAAVANMLRGMALLAEKLDDDYAGVFQYMAWHALDQCEAAEKMRCEVFRLTHPRRAEFDKGGWPS